MGWRVSVYGVILSWLLLATVQAQELPIFDAHIHYSQPDWQVFTPERILAILDQAGVQRALVSSTPDDGTLQLYAAAPQRIVPFLRPYRTREDMGSWPSDPAVQAYVEERLKRGIYKGIGEFHLSATQAEAPTVHRFAELAAQQQLFFHAHVDDVTVAKLLSLYPQVRILWAQAGSIGISNAILPQSRRECTPWAAEATSIPPAGPAACSCGLPALSGWG